MHARPLTVQPWSAAIAWPARRTAFYAALCLFTVLLVVCIGLQPLRGGGNAATGDGDPVRQISYLALFAATLLVARRSNWLSLVPWSLFLVFGWCWLSLIWAIEPVIALRRLGITTMLVVLVFAAVHRAGSQRSFTALWWALLVVLAVNYAAVGLSPVGIHRAGETGDLALAGSWRGATTHKNFAGPICALTVLVLLLDRRRINLALRWLLVAAAVYFLWRTQSKTALVLLPAALGCALIYMALGRRQRVWVLPISASMLLFVLPFVPQILGALNRYLAQPEALTGRTQVWSLLLRYAGEHPWLGAGFGSFWGIDKGPVGEWGESWVASIFSGHNGYLDILVQLGWPGVGLAVLALGVAPLWRILGASGIARRDGGLVVGVLVFTLGHNATESSLLNRDHPGWVLFVVALALLCQMIWERQKAVSPQSSHVDERVLNGLDTARHSLA
jgi:O-antigen ligase